MADGIDSSMGSSVIYMDGESCSWLRTPCLVWDVR